MFKNNKSNTIFLTVIALLTLVASLIGASFAYFTAKVKGDENNRKIIIKTANIGTINYVNGNELTLEGAYPGAKSNTVTFTISADKNATVETKYSVEWVDVSNNFSDPKQLIYTLTGTTDGSGTLIPNQNSIEAPTTNVKIGSGVVKPGETHEYSLYLVFVENGKKQDINQDKKFVGKIVVNTTDDIEVIEND